MTETYAKFKVNKTFKDVASDITYCGVYGTKYVFGIIDKDPVETLDQPFYIAIGDDGEIDKVYMPMFQDDAYFESLFARYEERFKYFVNNNFID